MLTDETQINQWKIKDNKKLYILIIEWLTDFTVKYVLVGLWLTLAFLIDGTLGVFLKCAVGYWLLSTLLLMLKKK